MKAIPPTSRPDDLSDAELLELRKSEFSSLTPETVFLNTAGGAPMCNSAVRAAQEVLSELAAVGDRNFLQYLASIQHTREYTATYIGAETANEIAFTANSSSSAAIAARMLRAAGVTRVFCPRYEFPTSTQALHALGFEVVFLGSDAPGEQPEDLTDLLTEALADSERAKAPSALVASHVNYLTGIRIDLAAAAAACKTNHLLSCINVTQSFGTLPIDIAPGIDILYGTGLKWAHAGFGTGFVYLKQDLVEKFGLPKLTGWISVKNPGVMDNREHCPLPLTKSLDMGGGAPPFHNILALGGALHLRAELGGGDIRKGIRRIEHRALKSAERLRNRFRDLGLSLLHPADRPLRSGIVSVEHPSARELHRRLDEHGILTTLRRNPEHNTESIVRFGVPFFITDNELERAAAAVEKIVRSDALTV